MKKLAIRLSVANEFEPSTARHLPRNMFAIRSFEIIHASSTRVFLLISIFNTLPSAHKRQV